MKQQFLPSTLALGWILFLGLVCSAAADVAQIDQNGVLYTTNYQRGVNYSSFRGVPGKANAFAGADGRAPAGGSPYQFQGIVTYGAVVIPAPNANLHSGKNYEQDASSLNLPRGSVGGAVTMVLRTSQAGAATFSQAVSFYFGSIIDPPSTDESGVLLTNTTPAQYWNAQPYTNNTISGASYYYSPNARQVFATVPGPIQITWRKFDSGVATGNTNKVTIGGLDYALTNLSYVVSGGAVKTPRKMYWTEKSFAGNGKPISVPSGSVGALYFAYSPALPQTVTNEFNDGNSNVGAGSTNATLAELRTIWYDPGQGLILAYNAEGRIFLELLGDVTSGGARQFLGYEIVDVFQQPVPQALTAELGEKIAAYPDGQSDAALLPSPVQATLNTSYLYQDASGTSGRTEYYAAALTQNPNDVLVHWLEAGVVGLRWPLVFNRYQQIWPTDPAKYSHYLRPVVATATDASLTAAQLSANNAPAIQYQDALDYPRAFLDESARFYTFLDATEPQHRTLLRFSSGTTVAFERVFSSLSTDLIRGNSSSFSDVSGVLARPGQLSALTLDGTGWGQLPSGVYFNGGSYTVEAWVNASEVRSWAKLLDFGNGATAQNVWVALSDGTTGLVNGTHYTNGIQTHVDAATTLPINTWVHLASVFDSTSSTLRIYLNGVLSASGTVTPPQNINRTNNYVGKSNGADPLAKMQLDSLRIWSSARTADQLQSDMQSTGYPAGTSGLQAQFNFDEGGTVAYDSSGNSHHMTLFGGALSTSASLAKNSSPRYLYQTALVGDRINPPAGELGATGNYLAGYILQSSGTSFHPSAYVDPFANGFSKANAGAIIPVNAIPGNNTLEVWWFRQNATNEIKNPNNGFDPVYWPAVIGRYSLAWPDSTASQIVMAGNAGSGGLESLQARGTIYTQNDPTLPGYNPNEEHALMVGGQAYALRDDLNLTGSTIPAVISGSGVTYSSAPYVLVDYTESDGRPALRPFKVARENAALGMVFDYVVEAGKQLQAPMPLPLLPAPLETITNKTATVTNIYTTNYNFEITGTSGDLPVGWTNPETNGAFGNYIGFTYRDRKNGFWVMRGMHAGLPTLLAGTYSSSSTNNSGFTNTITVGGGVNVPTTNYIHTSRRIDSLVTSVASSTPLPPGITFGAVTNGLAVYGNWTANGGPYQLNITDGDGSQTSVSFTFQSSKASQGPMAVNGLIGRPPQLAQTATNTNSLSMRFYYKTQTGFAWPNATNPPAVGTIVPYLRPGTSGAYTGNGTSAASPSLPIVYRPVWPGNTLPIAFGETLTVPSKGRPAIRGQSSAYVLYQQSIALASGTNRQSYPAVILHDPTRQKTFAMKTNATELNQMPVGVYGQSDQGRTYFPNLPPHLATRFYFDPNASAKGSLVLKGQFKDDPTGEKYVELNVLAGLDLLTLQNLCPDSDQDKQKWNAAIKALAVTVDTFYENPVIPGQYIVNTNWAATRGVGELVAITNNNTPVDSYALTAAGPGQGYLTVIVGNGNAFTPPADPVSMYVMRVTGQLYSGQIKVLPSDNPLSELITFEHTADLAGKTGDYEYEWKYAPPVDGFPPVTDATMSRYQALTNGTDIRNYTLGASGILILSDNWLVMRYRPNTNTHPLYHVWSDWTAPQFAEGYVKRVLDGINPFNQRTSDLNNNNVNTGASILTQAGKRYEGDIALNQNALNSYGLIEIYETVLNRARNLSINAGINYGPANDSLLLAAGYLSDLYKILGDEASSDADNPTIGIGTKDHTYGDVATALYSFKGQVASLLDEEMALLEGRDDVALPGVQSAPVYNRLVWNYTGGIDSGEVIYALNYNILDQNTDGKADAADAAVLYPQGHGDAYGHYLASLKGYYSLLMNPNFDWVPRVQSVDVLGLPVTVSYEDERKFAAAAAAVARTGREVFDLTWRKYYLPGQSSSWEPFATNRVSARTVTQVVNDVTNVVNIVREWGVDQWASRTGMGALANWVVGNAILPDVDADPSHEGIQKVDRTTVPELNELVATASDLQADMDSAEGRLSPLGVTEGSIAFDLNPAQVVGPDPKTHFEQIYERTKLALNNAVAAFDDAKDITRLMRSEGDSLADVQAQLANQELTFTNALIELYGTPYPDDLGPGKTYTQDYAGPDLFHYMYVETPELTFSGILEPSVSKTFRVDVQNFPAGWLSGMESKPESFDFLQLNDDGTGNDPRSSTNYIEYSVDSHGFYGKPSSWTTRRISPGQLQQAISEAINARAAVRQAVDNSVKTKQALDGLIRMRQALVVATAQKDALTQGLDQADQVINQIEKAAEIFGEVQNGISEAYKLAADAASVSLPTSLVAGLSFGGDLTSAGRGIFKAATVAVENSTTAIEIARKTVAAAREAQSKVDSIGIQYGQIKPLEQTEDNRAAMNELEKSLVELQGMAYGINQALQRDDDAQRKVAGLVAKGFRIQQTREIARQRTAAVIQGFSTRDTAFRLFRSEKLERYKTLFDLTSRYALLAANAYDYETGLLGTDQGKAFISRIIKSRALGIVRNGEPLFAGSNTGDPGISSALAEMKADFDVLKGRLGFNSPDVYSTLASLRTGNLRILPNTNGLTVWQDYLQQNVMNNILEDSDVRRYCQQVDPGNGLPVPGIVITFSTSINQGQNLFGQALAAGDAAYNRSSFATKINSIGVALEGYRGMNLPGANNTSDPNLAYLDPLALSANPYVYLIPVGEDIMRSPPLGDASQLRQWKVDDVAIPLPFNIGGSGFSTKNYYQSADSLTEPLFTIRKHQSFRPVDAVSYFTGNVYMGTSLQFSQYTNRRLIGRSVWNTQWKLVIPADALLADPKEGLTRFIQTVTDIKLNFTTYSYSGN
ncbi:MAG: hypothetical protein JWN25_3033 [Verrucomicrobiales bacterium]|nr:hypothetical protein [Verrucomicrobiales bacterium]